MTNAAAVLIICSALVSSAIAQEPTPTAVPAPEAPVAPAPAAAPALAVPAPAASLNTGTNGAPKQLKKVVVTGSMIQTADEVPVVPVLTVTAEDIARQGASSLSEVIKRLPQNTGSLDSKFQNGFAPGSAGVSLRGLGAKYTLVLLNGHRVAPYGYGQNISDAFADLNTFPLDAIERIDVLPEGASATYGSDAIGGVVNVVLKREFDGVQVKTRWGNTDKLDMFEQTYSITAGIHDKKKRTSLMLNLEYYHGDSLNMKDRSFSRTADQTYRGGLDWRSDLGPSPGYFISTDGSALSTSSADYPSSHLQMTPDGGLVPWDVGYIPDPNNPSGPPIGPIYYTTTNYYDFNPDSTLVPESQRYGVYMIAQHEFNENVDFFLETSYRVSWTRTVQGPTPISGDQPPNLYGSPNNYGFVIPSYNPYNIFNTDVTFRNRLAEFGPRIDEIDARSFRILPGLNLHLANEWEATVDFLYMPNSTKTRGQNYINSDALQAALQSTNPATAINMFAPYTNYAPGLANNPALIESLKFNPTRKGEAEITMASGKIGGPLFQLPGGKLRLAVGAEGRYETFSDEPDAITAAEKQVGTGGTGGHGKRDGAATFVEVNIPIFGEENAKPFLRALDLQVSGRMDYYSDFGIAATPKIGLKYSPREDLVFRGSWGQGFRAPSLQELYLGSSVSYDYVVDPLATSPYYGQARQYRIFRAGNPTLKPEESENWNFSLVYEPKFVPGLSVNVGWGSVRLKNAIDDFPNSYLLDNVPGLVDRNPITGEINTITNGWTNVGKRRVQFVDIGAEYVLPTSFGEFTFSTDLSWLYDFFQESPYFVSGSNPSGRVQNAGTYDTPEWHGNGSVFWTYRKFTGGVTVNWVGAFDQSYGPDYGLPRSQVDDWITVDLQAKYEFPHDFDLTIGVKNVADQNPPFSDNETEGYSFSNHDPIGRYWYVEVDKKF